MYKEFDSTNVNAEYAKCILMHWKCFEMLKDKNKYVWNIFL